jgi:YesN/AraC family two-component response regulator
MDDYLAKPFTKQTLTAVLERWGARLEGACQGGRVS